MINRIIGFIALIICSFTAHAAFLTIYNHTGASFSYASPVCYPINPSSNAVVPVMREGYFYTLSNCHGPVVSKVSFNNKHEIESIKVYSSDVSFSGNGFQLQITKPSVKLLQK